jgi:selenocysteine lyase/cysteine desulfurase
VANIVSMEPIGSQKHLFEIPDDVTYLNCAYMSPLLRSVAEAGFAGVRRKSQPWNLTAPDFFSEVEEVRAAFARIVEADSDGVAVIPAASYGIATAAANIPLEAGERIVLLAEQFPSNVLAWRALAQRSGAEIVTVPRPEDGNWTRAVADVLDERVKVVAVANCHWTDGSVLDLEATGERAREIGAVLVVDATQSVGAIPFDVSRVRPDVLVTATYKWLLGPYSVGLMWVAPRWREASPIEHSWMTREASEDFARLVDYRDTYRAGARRFDVGETANFALMPMVLTALNQILEWRVERVAASIRAITDRIAEEAEAIGLSVPAAAARAPHLIGINVPTGVPRDLPERLAAERVFVSVRGNSIRVSPHLYNDEDDVKKLIDPLARI